MSDLINSDPCVSCRIDYRECVGECIYSTSSKHRLDDHHTWKCSICHTEIYIHGITVKSNTFDDDYYLMRGDHQKQCMCGNDTWYDV